jgi:hypothetical protein
MLCEGSVWELTKLGFAEKKLDRLAILNVK